MICNGFRRLQRKLQLCELVVVEHLKPLLGVSKDLVKSSSAVLEYIDVSSANQQTTQIHLFQRKDHDDHNMKMTCLWKN